jgi:hypothetical protein
LNASMFRVEARFGPFVSPVDQRVCNIGLYGGSYDKTHKIVRSPAYQGLYEKAVRKKSLTRLTTRGNA